MIYDLNVLAVSENETIDDERKSDDENGVVNACHHDHANENVVLNVWHHDPDNASGIASALRHD